MWYENERGGSEKPQELDKESSGKYVYVRRNFVFHKAAGTGEERREAYWSWEEMKIPKEMWETAASVMGHDTALDDVYAALTELAEMIVGE